MVAMKKGGSEGGGGKIRKISTIESLNSLVK